MKENYIFIARISGKDFDYPYESDIWVTEEDAIGMVEQVEGLTKIIKFNLEEKWVNDVSFDIAEKWLEKWCSGDPEDVWYIPDFIKNQLEDLEDRLQDYRSQREDLLSSRREMISDYYASCI